MIVEMILVSAGTFVGGFISGLLTKSLHNYIVEERELRERTNQLYLEFVKK